jgi:NNP family nitrate/nitrite transporter-like MFS transporter
MQPDEREAYRALFLATTGFAIAFAVWGLLSGLAPLFKEQLGLSQTQASLVVSVPVLLGALGRLPIGLAADRLGARQVLAAVLLSASVPALALAVFRSYPALLAFGLLLGVAGTSFAVGVAYTAPWFPPERQGFALGVFGIGTGGQSLAVYFAPVLAQAFGMHAPFLVFGCLAAAWGMVVLLLARPAPRTRPAPTLAEALRPLRTEPLCWLFGLFYFVTFGGFVALGVYLPSLLREVFQLTPADAGARAAGFVLLATALRAAGGVLADRYGGRQILTVAFGGLALLAPFLAATELALFTIAALGIAVMLGLGNGAVFKLVPQYFPGQVGTVTGLVGAAGGLGGFFPPLVLGILKDVAGTFVPGFLFLAGFALLCLVLTRRRLGAAAAPV